ncbi:MAG: DUF2961 domain-containing protein [Planctomycetes bacterium]|nr:DUF2961 domain-containing protein [Planctomycetota bacterium]NOG53843.1 DUF2961 domain-containing protein [Planctomycetota bacterium]
MAVVHRRIVRALHAAGLPVVIVACALGVLQQASAQTIDLHRLLNEMVDRSLIAQWPDPAYTCKQFSSYDRASTTSEQHETWFANADHGQFLRTETIDGRQEHVMMDADGPGAIVHIWSANPNGTLRVYLDRSAEPLIEMPMAQAIGGDGLVGELLSTVRGRGCNLYLPIPYAEHCLVTCDGPDFYYQINYRTYADGTQVTSLTSQQLSDDADLIEDVRTRLGKPAEPDGTVGMYTATVMPGDESPIYQGTGPALISEFDCRLMSRDIETSLRSLILVARFDGEQTIECPIGDFFGAAPGINPYRSWWFQIEDVGRMISWWPMPFAENAEIRLRNDGSTAVTVHGGIRVNDRYEWDENTMHFHAGWKIETPIHTQPRRDWNYVTISGQGVYVGDMLGVTNPNETWWGEGDEKIYVDGETFPSHFGTGTEDYYSYAWCCNEQFEAPFHNQPRCDGPGNYGHTAVNRFRSLDAIPFTRSFQMDMEVWHWQECDVTYNATTYWYARPGATSNLVPIASDQVSRVRHAPPLPPPFAIKGGIEGESLKVLGKSDEDLPATAQKLWKKEMFSNDNHLWVQAVRPGQFVEVEIPVKRAGSHRIEVYMVKSWDYGIVQFSVNGQEAGPEVDTYNTVGKEIGATGPIDIGVHALDTTCTLRITVVGSNEKSLDPKYYFGLDAVKLTPVR